MLNVQNLVSISQFRQEMSTWLDKVQKNSMVMVLQNSKPKALIVDPEYLEYLENYANGAYDAGDIAEMKRAHKKGEIAQAIPFDPDDYL